MWVRPDGRRFVGSLPPGLIDEPHDAGIVIIDLVARLVVVDSTYSSPGPIGELEFYDGQSATEIGLRADPGRTADLRSRGIVATPEDLDVRRTEASRTLLAARSMDDLVAWSGGLYQPPARFRSW